MKKLQSSVLISATLTFLICCSEPKTSTLNASQPASETDTIIDTTTTYSNTTANLKSSLIPEEIFNMSDLRHLSIQGMDCDYGDTASCWMIKEIPGKIARLKKLESLSLNVNGISVLPREIGELQNLKLLDLADNPGLSDIGNIISLKNLEYLSLFGCGLSKLPEGLGELKNLKYLGLTGNRISEIELNRIKESLPNCRIIFSR